MTTFSYFMVSNELRLHWNFKDKSVTSKWVLRSQKILNNKDENTKKSEIEKEKGKIKEKEIEERGGKTRKRERRRSKRGRE
jgi:hypothetical protein